MKLGGESFDQQANLSPFLYCTGQTATTATIRDRDSGASGPPRIELPKSAGTSRARAIGHGNFLPNHSRAEER